MKAAIYSVAMLGLLSAPLSSAAQSKLYLDLRAGVNRNDAERAYFGKGDPPFKAYSPLASVSFDVQAATMLRLQIRETFGIAAGYSGSALAWSYSIKVPKDQTLNPFYPDRWGTGSSLYLHQFPLLLSKTFREYHFWEIDTVRHVHRVSIRLDAVFGGGLQVLGNSRPDSEYSGSGGQYDIIEFKASPVLRRQRGQFLTGGVTARFYHLGKERLNLSLYYTQGLTDMLLVPVEYRYNTQRGATTLHVRGSGFSATLGLPLRLATFRRREPVAPLLNSKEN